MCELSDEIRVRALLLYYAAHHHANDEGQCSFGPSTLKRMFSYDDEQLLYHIGEITWHVSKNTKVAANYTNNGRCILQIEQDTEVNNEHVRELFMFWMKTIFRATAMSTLTTKRRRKIVARLRSWSLEQLKNAIVGCSLSAFHMGENERNTPYNDIALIFRDDDNVEKFLGYFNRNAKGAATRLSALDRLARSRR